ncbi:polysaccharide deacetylase family protein [Glaciecola siphonariae]|uniref:Polysaccharide deacetylase family protein n=1 Tax=Glaciecola siphonariae TaxID=521012 RepID=A0ABV9LS45_9ALTE
MTHIARKLKAMGVVAFKFLLCVSLCVHYARAFAQLPPQVVVLQYHHVAHDTPSITSVTPQVFKEHMQYLSEHHSVIGLHDAIEALKRGEDLPANAVAITFDDGYLNILTNAHPILEDFGFKYTVFVNPDSVGALANHLSWEDIQSMQPLADFANHTMGHIHLLERESNESEAQWLKRVMQNINEAENALAEQLGYSRKWLAYPYGEFNLALEEALRDAGYIGFGQQSGVIANLEQAVPLARFPSAGRYSKLDTLKVKMASIAMPVIAQAGMQHVYQSGESLSMLTLHLSVNSDISLSQMACYFKQARIVPSIKTQQNKVLVSVPLEHTFAPGRVRVNCTAPSKAHKGRFYWHSVPFFTPSNDGTFLE